MKKYKKNIALIFLAAVMLFYAIPFGVGATGETENAEPQNRYNVTLTEDSPEYVREIAEKSQIYDEFEVVSLREENVKHFALADGTFKAVVYPYKIHEQDADGKWVEVAEFILYSSDKSGEIHNRASDYAYATRDTYVSSYSPSSNYGSSLQLYVGASTMRAYISLPKPTLPSNATITYGELQVAYWYISSVTTGYVTVGAYKVNSYWNASTLTWNTVQTGSGALAASAMSTRNLHAGNNTTQSFPGFALIDITEAVQDWYAGKANYGIALEYMGGTNTSVGICSVETGFDPFYDIYYTLDTLPVENGTYFLYNRKLERYLQIDPASNSSYMELWTLDGDDDQKWEISYLHNGYYKIKSVSSGLSLGIQSGSEDSNGARVLQESYTANARQQWAFSWSSNDYIVIRPRSGENYSTDWVMSAAWGLIDGDGREVVQRAYSSTDRKEEWAFVPFVDGRLISIPFAGHYHDTTLNIVNNYISSYIYTKNELLFTEKSELALADIASSKLFYIRTHGSKTSIVFSNGNMTTNMVDNLVSNGLSGCDLIFYGACLTGQGGQTDSSNLVNKTYSKGAAAVLGFQQEVYCLEVNAWATVFFEHYSDGDSADTSAWYASKWIAENWTETPITTNLYLIRGN